MRTELPNKSLMLCVCRKVTHSAIVKLLSVICEGSEEKIFGGNFFMILFFCVNIGAVEKLLCMLKKTFHRLVESLL